jgi:hypothetical protein
MHATAVRCRPVWSLGRCDAANPEQAGIRCQIKSSISLKGERLYHLPGGEFYGRTQVSARKGERWFCTEQEARAAWLAVATAITRAGQECQTVVVKPPRLPLDPRCPVLGRAAGTSGGTGRA